MKFGKGNWNACVSFCIAQFDKKSILEQLNQRETKSIYLRCDPEYFKVFPFRGRFRWGGIMGQYSIRDVEVLSGVKAHTLRIWEQRYDFLKPNRTDTNIRYYNDDQLKHILNICTLNRNGMRISKIACLKQEEVNQEVDKLCECESAPNVLLDALVHSMIEFDESRFEKTLSCAITKHGFAKAFTELIFPLLVRTGTLWATGVVRPAQEHFVTNLIRRKIYAAIDGVYVQKNPESRKFVLFLPEGETHDLMLLFTEYILRERNHEVAFIGSSLPSSDLPFLNTSFSPDYIVVYFTVPPQGVELQAYIDNLAQFFPTQKILVGGKQLKLQQINLPANVTNVTCIDSLKRAIP